MAASSAARAYPRERYERESRRRIEVRTGQGRAVDTRRNARAMSVFRLSMAVLALVTAFAVCRVWLTAASVSVLSEAEAVQASIDSAEQAGAALDVQYYQMVSPDRIQSIASDTLGMGVAANTTKLDLTPDFVGEVYAAYSEKVAEMTSTLSAAKDGYGNAIRAAFS